MAISISGRKIDQESEKNIAINLIIDDDFCKAILPIAKPEYFDTPHIRKIFLWIQEYYNNYKSSPGKYIQDIFNTKKGKLQAEDAEIIQDLLENLSNKFIEEGEKRNSKYFIEQAIPYLKKQSYIKLADNISSYAKLDQIEEVEKQIRNHRKVTELTSGCVNPHDADFIKETFKAKVEDILFTIPGPLGTLIKPEKGRLIAIMAPPKCGKTWMLHFLGLVARMNRLRVFETNLEMSATKINYRDLKMITGQGDESKEYEISCFDCKKNQLGICSKSIRASKIPLVNSVGEIPEFSNAPKDYVVCTACRGTSDYQTANWFFSQFKEELTVDKAINMSRGFGLMYGNDRYRLKCYPKFGVGVAEIEADLDNLAYSSGFYPDVLIVDYADVLRSVNTGNDVRFQLDEIWKSLSRIATERNILVLTASQTNRTGAGMKNISGLQIAEAFTKLAHLDSLIVLQSTPTEKKNGLLRASVAYNREGDCDPNNQILITQNLALAQPFLDSEFMGHSYEED
ncbi:MAG: hypothetical protein WC055_00885 [Melioribacteraceae bacterium]